MLSIYMIDLLVFPLTPTLYREDQVLEIEQMLRHGRKWFAPLYVLGLLTLFYALWRVLNTVHVLSKEDPGAAKSLRKWVLGIGVLAYLPVQHHSGAKHRDVLDRLALETGLMGVGLKRSLGTVLEFLDDYDGYYHSLGFWYPTHRSPAA